MRERERERERESRLEALARGFKVVPPLPRGGKKQQCRGGKVGKRIRKNKYRKKDKKHLLFLVSLEALAPIGWFSLGMWLRLV